MKNKLRDMLTLYSYYVPWQIRDAWGLKQVVNHLYTKLYA